MPNTYDTHENRHADSGYTKYREWKTERGKQNVENEGDTFQSEKETKSENRRSS